VSEKTVERGDRINKSPRPEGSTRRKDVEKRVSMRSKTDLNENKHLMDSRGDGVPFKTHLIKA